MLHLYNTLTHNIEEFKPLNPPTVTYYSCGPTVYDFAHIGHARTYIFADILERVLKYNGYKVKRVMNITDVGHLTSDADIGEDKMEKGAKRENKSVWDIAKFYTDDFFLMLEKLNINKPEIITPATSYILQMQNLIKTLEEKGFTYKISDGIYFDTSKFKDYGKLTGISLETLQKQQKGGIRVEIVKGKKHITDFALWKFTLPGTRRQMEWDSPWGKGFPGWHIECSAMAIDKLGESIDIHTGGVDHIRIHHTNEIAQSEAATGKTFVRYWLHAGHLMVNGEKMSKSLGNFFRLKDLEAKGFFPLHLRYLFLTASYRLSMNFTYEALTGAKNAYDKYTGIYTRLKKALEEKKTDLQVLDFPSSSCLTSFKEAVNDDLNTARGIGVIWSMLGDDKVKDEEKYFIMTEADKILGLGLNNFDNLKEEENIPDEIILLVNKREEARRNKDFKKADELRSEIIKKGYTLEDTKEGIRIFPL